MLLCRGLSTRLKRLQLRFSQQPMQLVHADELGDVLRRLFEPGKQRLLFVRRELPIPRAQEPVCRLLLMLDNGFTSARVVDAAIHRSLVDLMQMFRVSWMRN